MATGSFKRIAPLKGREDYWLIERPDEAIYEIGDEVRIHRDGDWDGPGMVEAFVEAIHGGESFWWYWVRSYRHGLVSGWSDATLSPLVTIDWEIIDL